MIRLNRGFMESKVWMYEGIFFLRVLVIFETGFNRRSGHAMERWGVDSLIFDLLAYQSG